MTHIRHAAACLLAACLLPALMNAPARAGMIVSAVASDGNVGTLGGDNIADILNGREADLSSGAGNGDPGDLFDADGDGNLEHEIFTSTNATGWRSDLVNATSNAPDNNYIQFDLGQTYTVDEIRLWGFMDDGTTNNEQHTFNTGNILFSDTMGFTTSTTAFTGTLVANAPPNVAGGVILEMGDNGTGVVDLTGVANNLRTGQFMRIEVLTTFSATYNGSFGNARIALGEIEFFTPEPASALLLGCGAVMFARRRSRPRR